MNILLIGYGKMGQAIEKISQAKGHVIKAILDVTNQQSIENISLGNIDIAIEFTQPDAAMTNIKFCIDKHIPVISGTTGWLDHYNETMKYCQDNGGTFLHSSNFSIGVNLFILLNERLGELLGKSDEWQLQIEEIHHNEKKDAPSGTAIQLAEAFFKNTNFKGWELGASTDNKIPIKSIRENYVPGTHTVTVQGKNDTIQLTHIAKNREGFAEGVIQVAEWLIDRKGVFTMQDFLKSKLYI